MSISIALLSWNRASVFVKTMGVSLRNGGVDIEEIVWVDNGSEPDQYEEMDAFMRQIPNVTRVRYPKNTGMPRGFNTAMALSRSKYVMLIGPDILFPDGWLKTFHTYIETIKDAGIVAAYNVPIESVPERYRFNTKEIEVVDGLPVRRAFPMEHYIFRRDIFPTVGYWREDFGLYGWADVEWLYRCERTLPRIGLNCYVIPEIIGVHLGSEGASEFKAGVTEDTPEYHAWKKQEAFSEKNMALIGKCHAEGFKYYSPF